MSWPDCVGHLPSMLARCLHIFLCTFAYSYACLNLFAMCFTKLLQCWGKIGEMNCHYHYLLCWKLCSNLKNINVWRSWRLQAQGRRRVSFLALELGSWLDGGAQNMKETTSTRCRIVVIWTKAAGGTSKMKFFVWPYLWPRNKVKDYSKAQVRFLFECTSCYAAIFVAIEYRVPWNVSFTQVHTVLRRWYLKGLREQFTFITFFLLARNPCTTWAVAQSFAKFEIS